MKMVKKVKKDCLDFHTITYDQSNCYLTSSFRVNEVPKSQTYIDASLMIFPKCVDHWFDFLGLFLTHFNHYG